MSDAGMAKRARELCRSLEMSHRTAITDDDGVTRRVRCHNCTTLRSALRDLRAEMSPVEARKRFMRGIMLGLRVAWLYALDIPDLATRRRQMRTITSHHDDYAEHLGEKKLREIPGMEQQRRRKAVLRRRKRASR